MSTQIKTPELAAAGAERPVETYSKTILPLPHAACLAGLTTLAICGLELAVHVIFG